MPMNFRPIQPEDLPEVFSWYADRKWPTPPVESVGPKHGFVSEEDGVMMACAWLYLTGTAKAYLDWTATNPSVDEQKSSLAMTHLIQEIKKIAEVTDPSIKVIEFITGNEKLAERFERLKFKKEKQSYRLLWTRKNEG